MNRTLATNPVQRFWSKVAKDGPPPSDRPDIGPCWLWTAKSDKDGYGSFALTHRKSVRAHRFAYELCVAKIPAGLVLDHLCRNPPCVNPSHLEPVTNRDNLVRGVGFPAVNAAKTHCPKGHSYDALNTYTNSRGARVCLICRRKRDREYKRRIRGAHPAEAIRDGWQISRFQK